MDIKEALDPIKEDIRELKETTKELVAIMQEFTRLQSVVEYDRKFADEARKVIHKRLDKIEKETTKSRDFVVRIIIGVSSVALASLLGILLGVVKL